MMPRVVIETLGIGPASTLRAPMKLPAVAMKANAAPVPRAPTGTIATVAGVEGYGCEPVFALAYVRHVNDSGKDLELQYTSPLFEQALIEAGLDETMRDEIIDEVNRVGTCQHIEALPEDIRNTFVVSSDIAPDEHVRMQAAIQSFVDNSISKTCNFPKEATVDDVRSIFQLAYELKCKGVTVYRDGSREAQVLSTGRTARKVAAEAAARGVHASPGAGIIDPETIAEFEKLESTELAAELAGALARVDELAGELEEQGETIAALEGGFMKQPGMRKRPAILKGVTRKIDSPLGDMYVTINEDEEGRPFEVFVALGKAGGPAMADAEAIGRLISLALRSGISLRSVHKQLRGISSDRAVGFGANKVLSSPDAIAQVVERYLEEKEGIQQSLPIPEVGVAKKTNGGTQTAEKPVIHRFETQAAIQFIGTCPDCGSSLEFAEGCMKCHACGYSECG